jgi:type IV fimbrial biogenesis protein FimT
MNKQNGVTLIELMTALAVAAILMSIAIPSFRQSIINNRLASITNEFISGINYARSEAIKLGRSVTLCKSSNGSSCSTDNTEFWDEGWIAFADLNADGVVDTGETILRTWPALDASYTLRSSEFPNFLRYNPQGASTGDGTFAVCHDSSETGATALIITRLRPRSGIDSDNDQIPETDVDGSNGNIGSCEAP